MSLGILFLLSTLVGDTLTKQAYIQEIYAVKFLLPEKGLSLGDHIKLISGIYIVFG